MLAGRVSYTLRSSRLWHGQFFLLPGLYPRDIPGRAIVARNDDAEALARVLRRFGLGSYAELEPPVAAAIAEVPRRLMA